MVGVGTDVKDHLVPTPLPQARIPSTRTWVDTELLDDLELVDIELPRVPLVYRLSLFVMRYFDFQCTDDNLGILYSEDIAPNTVHMAWQIPQYFILTCAEVLFSVTGLEFSYSQVGFALWNSYFPKNQYKQRSSMQCWFWVVVLYCCFVWTVMSFRAFSRTMGWCKLTFFH